MEILLLIPYSIYKKLPRSLSLWWESNQIPDFWTNKAAPIHQFYLQQGTTKALSLLTESQLIATMNVGLAQVRQIMNI